MTSSVSFAVSPTPTPTPTPIPPPPWQRSEQRTPCTNFSHLRQPYFGDTHVHTTYSFDAVSGDVRTRPIDVYSFAKGQPIDLPPYDAQGQAQRQAQLSRPLDFTVVTDHSEFFGEVSLCLDPSNPTIYNNSICVQYRSAIPQTNQLSSSGIQAVAIPYLTTDTPARFSFCGPNASTCLGRASLIWQDIQSAAAQAYDTTAGCAFTSFVGYEWSAAPATKNMHRNVIFRNDVVPALPITHVEQPTAQGLWGALKSQCLDAGNGCDVLAIPHNSNLSGGAMFVPEDANGNPLTAGGAAFRASMEPLVEVIQHKGDSECRPGVGQLINDELCGFEKWSGTLLGIPPWAGMTFPELLYVRNVLKEGLRQDQLLGVNPFQLGMIGSTDTHNSLAGDVREYEYQGHLGTRDASAANMMAPVSAGYGVIGGADSNPGGLAVVWAEENSRDALFTAMRRRETYATSGTRPIVRFFGGKLGAVKCGAANFVERSYQTGVPMGGELGALGMAPRFAVMAVKDPGEDQAHPGTPLQRIQIVKGWLDKNGNPQEKVYDVATAVRGHPDDGSSVDATTCEPTSLGAASLCKVWTDLAFSAKQRAFYYARVVEDPVCRWSTRLCNAEGVNCNNPASIPVGLEACCDPQHEKTIQERALTSPIWYRPEAIGTLAGKVQFGANAGTDVLTVTAKIRTVPTSVDPVTQNLVLTLRDDDTIFTATIPAGTMIPSPRTLGKFTYQDSSGTLGGLTSLSFNVKTGALSLKTVPMDLAHADQVEHLVEFKLSIGSYEAAYSRMWVYKTTKTGVRLLTTV